MLYAKFFKEYLIDFNFVIILYIFENFILLLGQPVSLLEALSIAFHIKHKNFDINEDVVSSTDEKVSKLYEIFILMSN